MYVPLRVHGHHSLLTGVDSPREIVERAKADRFPALALSDVDTISGLVDFLLASNRLGGPRPIVAAEISDPRELEGEAHGRVVALVRDERGYRNLCKLVSARHLGEEPGQVGVEPTDPSDFDLVESVVRYQGGLFFLVDHPRLLLSLSGRVSGRRLFAAISPASLKKRARVMPSSRALERRAQEEDDHPGIEEPKVPPPARATPAAELIEAARTLGIATLAVPDVYYLDARSAEDHRARAAIKHNALACDLPESWMAEEPAHLPGFREMCALYAGLADVPGDWPIDRSRLPARLREAPACVLRTRTLADACHYAPPLGGVLFPEVELGPAESAYSKLCAISFDGARERYQPLRPEVIRRLDYELSTIENLGFAPYFLLVKQIADYAREQGIPCVGRGSAADSLVAYCMKLTDADPLRYRLTFERFLNPARKDRPDIDLDFCWRRRDEVLEHVYEAFGAHRTAMICTLNTFGLRSAFRETALAEGIPPAEVNRWSGRLPYSASNALSDEKLREAMERGAVREPLPHALRENVIARALYVTPECRGFPFDDPRMRRALCAADRLIDAPRHFGLHPGGVVVSPGAITDFVACQRAAKGVVVTQLDKDAVEAIGLVKMDLLGNRALTTIDDCMKSLREVGVECDLEHLPENEPRTAEVLRGGLTLGCFQVESPGMRHLLQQTGASTMDDVIQAVALIRPGPAASGMKDAYVRRFRGREEPTPPHPRLTELLWETRGIMVYQEDVVQAASLMADMELAEGDLLRRALQKRRESDLEVLCRRFLERCAGNGIGPSDARRVWDLIANFASFAFCKAHAVTYGRIAYRAVYLKAHHPAAYLAAFLASETGYYEARVYVEEARRLGVPILRPDVNRSGGTFAVEWIPTNRNQQDPTPRTRDPGLPPRVEGAGGWNAERSNGTRTSVAHPAPATPIPHAPNVSSPGPTGCLRIGLGQVKGLSQATLDAALDSRRTHGPFLSLPDFLERTGARVDETENLVQCGAFDSFDHTRPELLWRLHLLTGATKARPPRDARLDGEQLAACRATPKSREREVVRAARARTGGWSRGGLGMSQLELQPGETASLFPPPETPALVLPRLPELEPKARDLVEFELMGLSVRSHPVELFPHCADRRIDAFFARESHVPPPALLDRRTESPVNPTPCARVPHLAGARVTLRGWLAASRRVRTANGDWMRFLTLEDESGIAEAVLFPNVYRRDGHLLGDRGPHCVTGIVEDQMGACTLHVEQVW